MSEDTDVSKIGFFLLGAGVGALLAYWLVLQPGEDTHEFAGPYLNDPYFRFRTGESIQAYGAGSHGTDEPPPEKTTHEI